MRGRTWGRAVVVALLISASVLTGCIGTGDPANDRDDGAAGAAQGPAGPATYPAGVEGCPEGIAIFLREPGELQSHLPQGFTIADASGLFGLPIPTGRAATFVNGLSCTQAEIEEGGALATGELGILVETPNLGPEATPTEPGLDFYMLEVFTDGDRHAALLSDLDGTVHRTQVTVEIEPSPAHATGSVEVADAAGSLYTFSYQVPRADPFSGTVRLWHTAPGGTAYFDLHLDNVPTAKGPVATCSVRDGSLAAEVLGTTTCAPGQASALILPAQAFHGTLHVLPGVFPS